MFYAILYSFTFYISLESKGPHKLTTGSKKKKKIEQKNKIVIFCML